MIEILNTEVVGWRHAIRGMRNPMNSWNKSDTTYNSCEISFKIGSNDLMKKLCKRSFKIGPNDLDLMKKLCNGGPDDRKFLRMLIVYADITAPLYWWKEYDTYKVGTVTNSCSTMHKIHAKKFEINDFSHEYLDDDEACDCYTSRDILDETVETLNYLRDRYLETKNKKYWQQMIQLLPTSYNQKRTVMLNYEVLRNMYHARKNHKLKEWHDFCRWIEKLPYAYELIFGNYPAMEWEVENCICRE